jgi:predicted nucleotidyltransferase
MLCGKRMKWEEQMEWDLEERIIFETAAGSNLYGTSTPESDFDSRGVCIAPRKVMLDPFAGFDQADSFPGQDRTIYGLAKFMKLCSDANPNILELLFAPENVWMKSSKEWRMLLNHRELFVSKKVRHTFSGYFHAQIKSIKNHKEWITNPPTNKPTRDEFGLTDSPIIGKDAMDNVVNVNFDYLTESLRDEVKRERQYRAAKISWDNYEAWEKNRNPKRKELEKAFGYDCYDDNTTEFLTESGWKKFNDVIAGKLMVGTVVKDSGIIQFQDYLNYTDKLYSGKLYVIDQYFSKAIVTPNHNLLVSDCHSKPSNRYSTGYIEEDSNWRLEEFSSLIESKRSRYHIRRAGVCDRPDLEDISDQYLSLAGLFISDGTVNLTKGKFKSIRFTQTKPGRFFDVANSLMDVFPIRRYDYKKETVWILCGDVAKRLYDDFNYKREIHLPNWCYRLSLRQVGVFWESLMLGDGCDKENVQVYYTSVKQLADDIHAMLVSSGVLSVVYGGYDSITDFGKIRKLTMYHVSVTKIGDKIHYFPVNRILKSRQIALRKEGFPIKELDVADRRVVCFEVPNGTLITRNSGKVAIHGNCKSALHALRLMIEGTELMLTGNITFPLPKAEYLLQVRNGLLTYEQLMEVADNIDNDFVQLEAHSTLPYGPDIKGIKKLYFSMIEGWD